MPTRPDIHRVGTRVPKLRMWVVAHQGWGKTVFCGTAPKALFLVTDPEGTVSAGALGSNADEVDISSYDKFKEAYIWLRDEGYKEYEFLIVDNGTELQKLMMIESMAVSKRMSNNPAGLDPIVPQQGDYNRNFLMFDQAIKQLFDLPMNVIITAHIKGMEDSEGEEFYSAAIHGLKGQVAQTCLGYANVVAMGESRLDNGGEKQVRRLWFSHFGAYRGKDRYVALGNYKDDLTVPKMMEIIQKKRGAATPVRRPASTTKTPVAAPPVRRRTRAVSKTA